MPDLAPNGWAVGFQIVTALVCGTTDRGRLKG
jgi:hypothetical protein